MPVRPRRWRQNLGFRRRCFCSPCAQRKCFSSARPRLIVAAHRGKGRCATSASQNISSPLSCPHPSPRCVGNGTSIKAATLIKPTTNENILRWLRGHILESGVQKFITNRQKEHGRKVGFSYEQLFTNAIHQFQSSFINGHPHYNHYELTIQSADGSF